MSWAADAATGLVDTFEDAVEGEAVVVAAAAVDGDTEAVEVRPRSGRDGIFEIGSITKTMTATITASLVLEEAISLGDEVGKWLDAGPNAAITVEELATHTSGLPRLAPNHDAWPGFHRSNPYAGFTAELAEEGLRAAARDGVGEHRYSNFGYQLLGLLLERVTGESYGELAAARLFSPLDMATASVGAGSGARLDGHRSGEVVPHWDQHLPGDGGVEATIGDMLGYLRACVRPPDTDAGRAIALTREPRVKRAENSQAGLAWVIQHGREYWHNGGSGGFHSMLMFDAEAGRGAVALINSGDVGDSLDRAVALAVRGDDPRSARPQPLGPEWEQSAREFLGDLAAGRFGAAAERVMEPARDALSAERLQQAWAGVVAQMGEFAGVDEARTKRGSGAVVVALTVSFGNGDSLVLHTAHLPEVGIAGVVFLAVGEASPW